MPLKITVIALVMLAISPVMSAAEDWTWIHGHLSDDADQAEYLDFARRMRSHYQQRGILAGPLVSERDLEAWPGTRYVVIGPVAAFADPDRFGLPLEITADGVRIGAQELSDPRTGIFLTDEDQTRYLYTGLSLEGFRDIFSVPTGRFRCTVTRGRGMLHFQTDDVDAPPNVLAEAFIPDYPTAEDVQELAPLDGAVNVAPVATTPAIDALDPAFAAWLDDFVADKRVLFFGEGHWNHGVNLVFHRIVEHLLGTTTVGAVVLENNWSFGAYYDHYVNEADDDRAAEFLAKHLHPLVSSSDTLVLLDMLRAWNAAHPDRRVRMGCLDMEWDAGKVMKRILLPYLHRLDPSFRPRNFGQSTRTRLRNLIAEAVELDMTGELPFHTATYMSNLAANLLDTADISDRFADRQRGIIRNLTEFDGHLLEDGLVVFKGGGWHAIRADLPHEAFRREAAYLDLDHPSTRGRVATLSCRGIGYDFSPVADLDLDKRMGSATTYNEMVRDYQQALADGLTERGAHLTLDHGQLDTFDRLVIRQGHLTGCDAVWIDTVDWDRLERELGDEAVQATARNYDATIYVLRAELEVMRPVEFEGR